MQTETIKKREEDTFTILDEGRKGPFFPNISTNQGNEHRSKKNIVPQNTASRKSHYIQRTNSPPRSGFRCTDPGPNPAKQAKQREARKPPQRQGARKKREARGDDTGIDPIPYSAGEDRA
jgi:hypothetical protein